MPIGFDDPNGQPPSRAADAFNLLSAAHDRWDAHLTLVSEESLGELIGPIGGTFADRTRVAYVLHMLDEFVHHGAEVALLRDLWRWQQPVGPNSALQARCVVTSVSSTLLHASRKRQPSWLRTAATYARWELVTALVDVGVPVTVDGKTPLHVAAGTGELDIVKLLVERGADVTATDPEFHATPLDWAQFMNQSAVAEWLSTHSAAQ